MILSFEDFLPGRFGTFGPHHVTREEILQQVWEYSSEVTSRTVDVHVAWLRQKLEDQPQNPRHIQTIRGKGYRFTP